MTRSGKRRGADRRERAKAPRDVPDPRAAELSRHLRLSAVPGDRDVLLAGRHDRHSHGGAP